MHFIAGIYIWPPRWQEVIAGIYIYMPSVQRELKSDVTAQQLKIVPPHFKADPGGFKLGQIHNWAITYIHTIHSISSYPV